MSEWKLPDEMIGRGEKVVEDWGDSAYAVDVFRAIVGACDVCKGSGKRPVPTTKGVQVPIFGEQCEPCHGTGLAGIEWRCKVTDDSTYECFQSDTPHAYHKEVCGLILVVPLERSE